MNILSYAKINLYLAATGIDSSNYHSLIGLTIPLKFCDKISVTKTTTKSDTCTVSQDIGIENQEQNLAFKAIKYFKEKTKCEDCFNINITKNIPVMAGFGGGSSNAVAVLKLLEKIYKNKLSDKTIYEICSQLGTDCHFFVKNQAAIIRGRGEKTEILDSAFAHNIKRYHFVIFKPCSSCNTTLAYKNLREHFQYLYKSQDIAMEEMRHLVTSVENFADILPIFNTFAEIAHTTDKIYNKVHSDLNKSGIQMMLTGSGSGCFCIFKDTTQIAEIEKIVNFHHGENIFLRNTVAL